MTETWGPVVGWEGIYEVSDEGRVRSVDRAVKQSNGVTRKFAGKILRQTKMGDYLTVGLHHAGREERRTVHRMVLETFVGPRPDGKEACHGDSNGRNNYLSNLRWGTRKENAEDRVKAGHAVGWQAAKTHCKHGHEFTPENTYRRPGNPKYRICRACASIARKRRYWSDPDRYRKEALDNYRKRKTTT